MTQVLALSRMRFGGYARSQRVLAPVLATLVLLTMLQVSGGGSPADAYGMSALVLFSIFGWQAKLSLDTEPDVQRQLSLLAVGSGRREIAAGLVAAGLTTVPTILAGLLAPWLTGAMEVPPGAGGAVRALLFGLWVHVLAAVPGVAVGAWASRPITRTRGWGAVTLVGISIGVLVLDLTPGPQTWLVPQLVGAVRAGQTGSVLSGAVITVHALIWSALGIISYLAVRGSRR
jgi:hypothetical protein